MEKNVFTVSSNFKSEYSAAVVKLEKLTPIEGSDFLMKTNVFGTQIVVRNDVKEGDIMIYASNETQINEKFLSVNNMFEVGCRDKNANAEEVNEIYKPYIPIKEKADKLRNDAKNVKGFMDSMTKKAAKYNSKAKKLEKELASHENTSEEYNLKMAEIEDLRKKADECTSRAIANTTKYTALKKEVEETVKSGSHIIDEVKKHCGYMNKYGRVRCLTLRNTPSFGILFRPEELFKYDPTITMEDLENYVGQEFDTINGELFLKVFIPPLPVETQRKPKQNKAQKRIKQFDRMVEGEFFFHYNTLQLQKTIQYINPEDVLDISVKRHGCVERNTMVDTKEFGKKTIGEIVDNKIECHIKAYDTDTDTLVFVPIDNFYTIPNDGEWFEIELENGKKITITGNNPVWLPELGVYRRVDELNGDEKLLISEE